MFRIMAGVVSSAAVAMVCVGGLALGTSPIAGATNTNVQASGGAGTAVDHDGTQGDFTNAVQGKADDDGYQDAYMTTAEEATPQYTAGHK